MSVKQRIEELGLTLPPATKAVGVYKPAITVGNICYTSGHGPLKPDGSLITGRVGDQFDQEAGYQAARQTGLAILATLEAHLGDLDRIVRVLKLYGMVWCTSDFDQHPAVINGCSELFRDIFGEDLGIGVRSAVGMNSLPIQMMVEIEGMFEVKV